MILTLEVLGEQAEDLGAASRKVFDSIGGTVGRLPDNDWVFPDPYVSGRHALIRYVNGRFFVEDTSTNGVFVNSPDNRLSRAQAYQLRDGDMLYIDAYRIQVSIEKPAAASRENDDPFELLKAASRARDDKKTTAQLPNEDRTVSMGHNGEELTVEWIDDSAYLETPRARALQPPAAARPAQPMPQPPVRTTPPPPRGARGVERAETADSSGDPLGELMAAAGIVGVQPSADVARTLGEVLRVVIDGLMETLRARERMQDDMHLRDTTFKTQNNNPLKFSANVDDALHNLLVKHNPAYLDPPEAFDDALRDIRDHQAALAAAMRLAFEEVLTQFEPDRMQEAGFRTLFGEAFARAYEDHLGRLQALARSRGK